MQKSVLNPNPSPLIRWGSWKGEEEAGQGLHEMKVGTKMDVPWRNSCKLMGGEQGEPQEKQGLCKVNVTCPQLLRVGQCPYPWNINWVKHRNRRQKEWPLSFMALFSLGQKYCNPHHLPGPVRWSLACVCVHLKDSWPSELYPTLWLK